MQYLKQSTAVDVMLGVFVDDTDGKTTEEALTLAQADLQLSKNCGAAAQKNEATSATHIYGGNYKVPLDTTDTGTLGRLDLMCKESGALPIKASFMVVTANFYDSVCGSDVLQADLTQMGGVAQSATDLKDFADAGYDPSTNKVQGVVLTDTCTTNTDMRGTDSAALASVCTETRLAELDAANLPTDVDSILVDTGTTLDGKINTIDTVVDAVKVVTDNLPDAGALSTIDGIVDAILVDTNELQTDWANGGRLDLILDACALEATVAALNDLSAADVNAEVVDVLKIDTVSEMGQGAPSATPSMEDILNYLYRKFRNKTETTASEDAVYDDAGTTKLIKSALSDDGTTFTKGEYTSGA